ncbi:hypothetical protein B0T16DRAFT_461914 [Cercophora newfieldiana]|uniref:Uncharacterized protein n=1 Tax=Cercophora newfieldiana TaxID=92897 RepID=A0AA39XXH3_9PEZI|nr:hypothetical protein B0T16DRAFT_461914 [Cercophora newfieldiana]
MPSTGLGNSATDIAKIFKDVGEDLNELHLNLQLHIRGITVLDWHGWNCISSRCLAGRRRACHAIQVEPMRGLLIVETHFEGFVPSLRVMTKGEIKYWPAWERRQGEDLAEEGDLYDVCFLPPGELDSEEEDLEGETDSAQGLRIFRRFPGMKRSE